jgi:hypothetical protein
VELVQGALTCQPRFNLNGDGTLTDNRTGLMWEITTSACAQITCNSFTSTWSNPGKASQNGTLYSSFLSVLNANTSTSGASACFANHCDWRIPNIGELQTIIETSAAGCNTAGGACIDPAFGPVAANAYWSSTGTSGSPGNVLAVNFSNGRVESLPDTGTFYALAVRSGRRLSVNAE